MEEWVGERWHHWVTRWADDRFLDARVELADVQRAIELMFRAGGGDNAVRVADASAEAIGGRRSWLQKLAGTGDRTALSMLDAETLALPASLAVFPTVDLNRDLYLWLAAQSAHIRRSDDGWIADNLAATSAALRTFPGLARRHARLLQAQIERRPPLARLKGDAREAEALVQAALRGDHAPAGGWPRITPAQVTPVWLWMAQRDAAPQRAPRTDTPRADAAERQGNTAPKPADRQRRRAEHTEDTTNKNGLTMFFRAESILSWSEFVRVNRTGDDGDEDDARIVADDMSHLSIAPDGETLASRVKFDLDLPSASADDSPAGEGEPLPEWDWKRRLLVPDVCRVQKFQHLPSATADGRTAAATALIRPELRPTIGRVRRRLEALRPAPRSLHGLDDGEQLDLDAWVRHRSEQRVGSQRQPENPPVFQSTRRVERSLCTTLLADLSLSTDAYATPQARVIDLIRDALLVFGQALHAAQDPFEVLGFSSVRKQLRIHEIKTFNQTWNDAAQQRVAAIKPGFYTRMGAAIRHATTRLQARGEQQRLLLILSDGKPNDLDHYEGRWGLEDTRQAVLAAKRAGIVPFCLTIDQTANDYLPHLFGHNGHALVHQPAQLVNALTQVYVRLTAAAR